MTARKYRSRASMCMDDDNQDIQPADVEREVEELLRPRPAPSATWCPCTTPTTSCNAWPAASLREPANPRASSAKTPRTPRRPAGRPTHRWPRHRIYLTHLVRGLAYGTGTAFAGLLAYRVQQRI